LRFRGVKSSNFSGPRGQRLKAGAAEAPQGRRGQVLNMKCLKNPPPNLTATPLCARACRLVSGLSRAPLRPTRRGRVSAWTRGRARTSPPRSLCALSLAPSHPQQDAFSPPSPPYTRGKGARIAAANSLKEITLALYRFPLWTPEWRPVLAPSACPQARL